MRFAVAAVAAALAAAPAPELSAQASRPLPPLPDTTGWGIHILAMSRAPDGSLWVGTYGEGIFVLRPGEAAWENIRSSDDTSRYSISWDFVHAFAFKDEEVWYGTVGNGWGVSRDGGRTWRNWQFSDLGPRWLYVAPNGIVARLDTVFVATADGIRFTADGGGSWGAISDSAPGGLPSRYVLTIEPARGGGLWVSTLRGIGEWRRSRFVAATPSARDSVGSRTRAVFPVFAPRAAVPAVLGGEQCAWVYRPERPARRERARWECMSLFERAGGAAVRAFGGCDGVLCAAATSIGAVSSSRLGLVWQPPERTARSRDVYAVLTPARGQPGDTLFGTACGFLRHQPPACLELGDTAGTSAPAAPRHTWFARPISLRDQPYIDQTYRYGSTMGGNFQQHQGVEFNGPAGTPVLAIGSGTVVRAGRAEQGSLTVAIRHDSTLNTAEGVFTLFSVYYHASALLVREGQRVTRGQVIARVGSTGRATNDHLHLEVHASPTDSVAVVVDPENRYPPFTRNPELWIEPLPGTGIVAGRVWDSDGRPVRQARVYGLVKPEPQETPFSFAETYGERAHPDPAYGEHFAVGDVPPGEYVLGTAIDGRRVFRRITVEAGKVTWVELRP